jgi:hypothetical protein
MPEAKALSVGRTRFSELSLVTMTPYARCASTIGTRPLMGMFSICRSLST